MILKMINKIVALTIIFTLVFEQSGFAQVAGPMGIPAYINGYVSPDKFRPLQLRSLSFDQINNDFNLFLDKGDLRDLKPREIKENGAKLSEYFQIGLRLPNSTFWVNLRPDAQDQIIDPWLEKTDLGKVMLEADLQLKKDMANFTSPQTPEGKNYWDNLYKKAEELFGQSEITIPTLTRPWIVPGEILIRQTKDNAYIYKAALNVMLEQDYLKDAPEYKFDDPRLKTLNQYSSELIRQEILPKLTREVNSSKNYAGLRQVYYSLVLAQWFKQSHQDDSRIDNFGLSGLTSKKSWSKTTYFKAYKNSFAKGEYKLQETVSRLSGTSIRQYFSGGEKLVITPNMISVINPAAAGDIANQPSLPDSLKSGLIEVQGGNVINDGQQQLRKKDGGSAQEVKDGVDQSFKDKLNFLAANLSAPPSVSSADEGGSDTAGDHYWDKLEKVVKGVITSRKEYDDFMTNLNKEISKAGISGILSWLFHPIYNVRLDRVYNKLGALGTRNTLSFREDSASQLEPGLVRLNNGFTAPENLVQEAWNKLEIGDNHDRFMANALSMSARFPGIFELTAQEEAFWKKEGILREDGSLDPVIRNIVLSSFDGDGAFELRVRDPKASDKKDGGNKQAVSFDKVDYRKAQNYGMALATGMWWVAVVTGSLIMVSSLGWLVGVSALAAGIFLMMFTGSSTADFITDKVVFRLMYGETRSQNLERFGKMEIIQDPKRDGGAQALTENKPGNIFVRPFIALC